MLKELIVLIGAMWLAAYSAYWVTDNNWQQKWSDRDLADSKAETAAANRVLEKEREWKQKLTKVQNDARARENALEADAAELSSVVDQLRSSLKAEAGKSAAASSTIAELRRTAATAAVVRTELCSWAIGRAEALARFADRSRAAGLACVASYKELTND